MGPRQLLRQDAGNRAHRVFLQGLAIDVGVAVSILAYNLASTPDDELSWYLIGASLARTVVQSGAAFVMRAFIDPSRVPTPLPPLPQPAPAELADGTEVGLDERPDSQDGR